MISFAMSRKPEWQRGEHTVTLHMTLPEAVDWIYNHLDWYTLAVVRSLNNLSVLKQSWLVIV